MITIGIPTYNEEKTIAKSINSALRQISKKDEVLVVASGCTDNTVNEIKEVIKQDKRVRLITEKERKGKASALNLIIKNAKGDIIVQTDGDVIIGKGAVDLLVNHFKDPKIGAVSGNPIPIIPEENLFYDWTIMSYRKIGEVRQQETEKGIFWHLSGYLLAFRKKALNEVPFAKGAVDAWMGKIIKDNGYKMVYESEAQVFVKAPLNIKDFVAQKARVRAGYYLLPKGPRTVKKEIIWFPKELIKIPITRWPKFLISGFVYLYSWIKGWYLARTNKSLQQIWKTPESTKQ
jgi:glycosyltransferase involved in cell wall biosynthesis